MQSLSFAKQDKRSDYNKFKIVAGENFAKVHALGQDFSKKLCAILEPIMPQYEEFALEVEALQAEYSNEDADVEEFKVKCAEIREKYKDVLKEHHERNLVMDKMLDEEVEVELEKFPLEKIPTNITGSFLKEIKPMLLY